MKRRAVSILLTAAMASSLLIGCGTQSNSGESAQGAAGAASEASAAQSEAPAAASTASAVAGDSEGAAKYPEFLTVDVFDSQANYQGIQSGWFAKLVKDKFNMELNIIAPNVAGGGDTLFQTRSANGNLGDLILTNANKGRLQDLVTAGLVMDMTPYMEGESNLNQYPEAIKTCNDLVQEDGIYAIPSSVSKLDPTVPGEVSDPTSALCLRWDIYQQIGAPEIESLDDLLDVLKKMQDAAGKSDSGKDVYAMSLFSDWDGDYMQNAFTIGQMFGYDILGTCQMDVDTGENISIIDDNSMYVKALRFYFKANQMGLIDPESTTQNYDTMASKMTDGAILYSFWPWCGKGLYNSTEHMSAGKGFEPVPLKGARFTCFGATNTGSVDFDIMVGSKAKDPQRMVDFIDWLYSPEAIVCSGSQTASAPGPEGLTWELNADGKPVFTDFGKQVIINKDQTAEVPAEWGGGTYADGISALNYQPVGIKDVNPDTQNPYNYQMWDDYYALTETPLSKDYADKTGYEKPLDYLQSLNQIAVIPGNDYAAPQASTDIETEREQCKQVIVDSSWKMAFAESEDEFNATLKDMQDTAKGLGFDDVYAVDEQNSKDRYAAFQAVRGN